MVTKRRKKSCLNDYITSFTYYNNKLELIT